MADTQMRSALAVLNECFWGEYNLTAQEILYRFDKNDPGFREFLFSKIIENSKYPSLHIRNLFPAAVYKSLLEEYLKRSRYKKRIRLIAANLTGDYSLAPEYQWQQ